MSSAGQFSTTASGGTRHPLDSLSARDIVIAVQLLRKRYGGVSLRFKNAEVKEPPKTEVVSYLEAERLGTDIPSRPKRIISLTFHPQDTKVFAEALVDIGNLRVLEVHQLDGVQGPLDIDEYKAVEQACLTHPKVLAEVEKMKLPPGARVIAEPWIYGTDDPTEERRLVQLYMFVTRSFVIPYTHED